MAETTAGCAGYNDRSDGLYGANHPSFKDEALLYMQEKYGEAFTWVEPVDGQFGNAQKSGHVASPAFPGERILVTGIPGERESFSDNYIAYLRQEEATRQLQAIASSVDRQTGRRSVSRKRWAFFSAVMQAPWIIFNRAVFC